MCDHENQVSRASFAFFLLLQLMTPTPNHYSYSYSYDLRSLNLARCSAAVVRPCSAEAAGALRSACRSRAHTCRRFSLAGNGARAEDRARQ